jgi:hypothetical protein
LELVWNGLWSIGQLVKLIFVSFKVLHNFPRRLFSNKTEEDFGLEGCEMKKQQLSLKEFYLLAI